MATLAEKDTTGTLQAGEGEMELVDRRTRRAKVFHRVGTRQYRIGASLGPVHYRRDPFDEREDLKEIDLRLDSTPGEEWDFACETNGYQVRVWQSRGNSESETLSYVARFTRAGNWFEMAPIALYWDNDRGQRQTVGALQAGLTPVIDNEANTITWQDAFGPGLHFRYNLRPDQFSKALVVDSLAALPPPTGQTASRNPRLVLLMSLTWDPTVLPDEAKIPAGFLPGELTSDASKFYVFTAKVENPTEFSFKRVDLRDSFWWQVPRAWDSSDEGPDLLGFFWQVGISNTAQYGAKFCVPWPTLQAATYPVFLDVDIAEEGISTNSDDGRTQGAVHPGSTGLFLCSGTDFVGAATDEFYCVGMRFQTIPIPQGATIDSASVAIQTDRDSLYAIDLYIHAEDVDSGATWAAAHTPADGYGNRTTAKTRWTTAAAWTLGSWYQSPDIGAVVEEVVGRPGWALNADLNLLITNVAVTLPGTNMWRRFDTYEGGAGGKFNCSYTEAAAGGNWLFASD